MHLLAFIWPVKSPYPPHIDCTCGWRIGPDFNLKNLIAEARAHIAHPFA